MNNEPMQRRDSLKAKLGQALSNEQLKSLSSRQIQLFENRLALMLDKYQDDEITPEMIQGHYEIVTEVTMPSWMEQGMADEEIKLGNPPQWIQELNEYRSLPEEVKDALGGLERYRIASLHVYDDPDQNREEQARIRRAELNRFREQVDAVCVGNASSTEPVLTAYIGVLEARISEWLGFDIPDEGDEDYDRWQKMVGAVKDIETVDDAREVAAEYFGDSDEVFECLASEE